jgi:hypothetical protein
MHTMEYYLDLVKKEVWVFVTSWMNLEDIMLGKSSQSERQILFDSHL